MNKFSSLMLKIFDIENRDFFIGARVQKIQQPTRKDLIITLRNFGVNKKFYININPEYYHLCFADEKNLEKRNINIPQNPPMFCMLLRKHIQSSKITNVIAKKYERIYEIYFENYNELDELCEYCLAIELMGKHSNIILYNSKDKVIIGSMHNVGEDKSRIREVYGGIKYIYPQMPLKKDLEETNFEEFYSLLKATSSPFEKIISQNFYYLFEEQLKIILEQFNISQKDFTIISKEKFLKLYNTLLNLVKCEQYSPCLHKGNISLIACSKDIKFEDINSVIDEQYSKYQNNIYIDKIKSELLSYVQKNFKKISNNIDIQEKTLAKQEKAEKYKIHADLIMANLYNLSEFDEVIELKDFENNLCKIQMNKQFSATENANKYYKLYKKIKNANLYAINSLEKLKEELVYLKNLNVQIKISNTVIDLEGIKDEILPSVKQKKKEKTQLIPIIYKDYEIYIGKNNKQNDLIYSNISSPEDLWFHVLNQPSGHILVKHQKNKNIPDSVILKACELAKEYSLAKNSSKTSVIYTKRKYLRRPPNTKAGYVTYKNETEIVV